MKDIEGIIFDLDGTLWSAVEGCVGAWNEVLSEHNDIDKKLTEEELAGCMGLQIPDIGKKLFPELSSEYRMQIMNECCSREQVYLGIHGGKVFPNVEDTLKKLKEKYKLFLVSNCQDGYIQCFFKAHGLGKYFTDIECSGVTGMSKGENNKLIMKRNNINTAVYVGDTIKDKESADVAGIPFIFARYGFGQVDEYDYVIDEFEDLLKIF